MLLRSETRRLPDVREPVLAAVDRRARIVGRAYRLKGLRGAAVLAAVAVPDAILSVEWFALNETVTGPADGEDSGLEFRWGDEASLPLLTTLGRPAEELAARLRRGDRVLMALDGGRLVGYTWFRAGAWSEHGITFSLRPDELWVYDAFVAVEHRGRRIHSAVSRAAAHDLRHEGIVRFLAGVDHLNGPSMRSAGRRGSRRLESLLVIRVLGLGLLRRSGARDASRWTLFRRAAGASVALPLSDGAATWS